MRRISLGKSNIDLVENWIEESARIGRWVVIENLENVDRK